MEQDTKTLGPGATAGRGHRATRVGMVTSAKRQKSICVRFDFSVRHEKYGKYQRRSTMLHAHDENNDAKEGDVVEVTACRRLSKTKSWRLTRVVRRAS